MDLWRSVCFISSCNLEKEREREREKESLFKQDRNLEVAITNSTTVEQKTASTKQQALFRCIGKELPYS